MHMKLATILSSLMLVLPFGLEQPAQAKPKLNVNIDIGTGVNAGINDGRRISCNHGIRRLDQHGFNDIRAIDCRGRNYVYRGWVDRGLYEVAVESHDGEIIDIRRIRHR